jgi:hypothetical protein
MKKSNVIPMAVKRNQGPRPKIEDRPVYRPKLLTLIVALSLSAMMWSVSIAAVIIIAKLLGAL